MYLVVGKYVRRSLCVCGQTVLRDDVPLGKEYVIDADSIERRLLGCGRCGQALHVRVGQVVEDGLRTGNFVIDVLEFPFPDFNGEPHDFLSH